MVQLNLIGYILKKIWIQDSFDYGIAKHYIKENHKEFLNVYIYLYNSENLIEIIVQELYEEIHTYLNKICIKTRTKQKRKNKNGTNNTS